MVKLRTTSHLAVQRDTEAASLGNRSSHTKLAVLGGCGEKRSEIYNDTLRRYWEEIETIVSHK